MSEFYEQAVEAVQAGDEDRARQLFAQALRADPTNEDAWLGLASLVEGERRREALERVLMLNPENERARQQLGYGAEEEQVLPAFEQDAEPPEEVAEPAVPEPVPPAATSPVGADADEDSLPDPVPPSEAAVEPALPGATAAASTVYEPEAAPPAPGATRRTPTVAMIVEIVFGLFGTLGIGWMYAGNLRNGLIALVGFLILFLLEIGAVFTPLGIFACLFLPLNVALVIYSGVRARNYAREVDAPGNIVFPILGVMLPAALFLLFLVLLSELGPVITDFGTLEMP